MTSLKLLLRWEKPSQPTKRGERIKDTLEVTVIDVTFGKNCVVLKTDSRETPKIEVAFVDFGWEGLQTHSCRISHNYDGLGWSEISVDDGARIVKNTH